MLSSKCKFLMEIVTFLGRLLNEWVFFSSLVTLKVLSINSNGDIIVADTGNGSIKIFSRGGECLRKFGRSVDR